MKRLRREREREREREIENVQLASSADSRQHVYPLCQIGSAGAILRGFSDK